jgi:hypothetical protein
MEGDKKLPYGDSANTRLSKVPLKRGEDKEKVLFSGLDTSNFIHTRLVVRQSEVEG